MSNVKAINMTEKKELLIKAYNKLLNTGFGDGPLNEISQFIDERVMGYGTAQDEKIISRDEFTDLIIEQRKQAENFDDFSFISNPVLIEIYNDGKTGLVVDEIELITVIEKDKNNLSLRMSSVFEMINHSWKLIHWHGSKAEHVSGGVDPWHVNEWKQKNAELQKLVDEKTNDIVQKNRELEIEASLERVRSVAMGMSKSEDLIGICEVTFNELTKLGFKDIRNAVIHIPNDQEKYLMDYDYSDSTGGVVAKIKYGLHPIVDEYIEKIRSAADAYFEVVITESELKGWNKFRKESGQGDDPRLKDAKAIYYYLFSIGIGDIGISSFQAIDSSQIELLKRFRNVFDLAYKRFTDIEKAEQLAYEAQIEASLERVRARTMAMQNSKELSDVVSKLFEEFNQLGIEALSADIIIFLDDGNSANMWVSGSDGTEGPYLTKALDHPHQLGTIKAWQNGDSLRVTELKGDLFKSFFELAFDETSGLKTVAEETKQYVYSLERVFHTEAFTKHGCLRIASLEKQPKDKLELLIRFAEVFNQTYTRFLDLQKAEAQTREAQIEAVLERIRSRAMAMQSSDELKDVASVLRIQMALIGQSDLEVCAIHLYDVDENYFESWGALRIPEENGKLFEGMAKFPKTGLKIVERMLEHYKSGEQDYILLNEGEMGQEWLNALKKYSPDAYSMISHKVENTPIEKLKAYWSVSDFTGGALVMVTYVEPDETSRNLLRRAASVFGLAYRRYIDLKKAEAQSRETQIELALERIRARTMAMQKSDELAETSLLLFQQFKELGAHSEQISIGIVNKDKKELEVSATLHGNKLDQTYNIKFDKQQSVLMKIYNAWNEKKESAIIDISGNELIEYNRWRNTLGNTDFYPTDGSGPSRWIIHMALFNNGMLSLSTHEPIPDETFSLLRRFAKVFEQTYTRFLDLTKAEAQAREGQIQLALEKVRMVALGLNKSEEMLEVAKALYEQLHKLGFSNIRNAIIDINNDDGNTFTDYDYSHEMSGTITQMSYHDDPTLEGQFKKMSTTTDDFFELVLEGKELQDLINMRIKNGEAEDPRLLKADLVTYNLFSFGNGAIGISNFGLLNDDEKSILDRFRNVFTFAYKRYTDLAAAEAQAREVQVELSLERIRNQVTAMQESSQLLDIVVTMRTEFISLGHEAHYFWHMRYLPDKYEKAMTSGDGTKIGMVMELPRHIHGDIKLLSDWEKSDEPSVVYAMDVEEALDYVDKMISLGEFKQVDPNAPTEDDIRHIEGLTFVMARTTHGEIGYSLPGKVENPPSEDLAILVRFAAVFDLAYKRFEDLKHAEAQAREAKIEAALERVRAKAMAMHSSEDLAQTVDTFFLELNRLNVKPHRCGVGIVDAATRTTDIKATSITPEGEVKKITGILKLYGHPVLDNIFEHWEMQKEYHPVLRGKEIKEYYSVMNPQITFPDFADDEIQHGYYFMFKEGGVFAWTDKAYSEGELQIFRRYTSVLSLTYRRYIDLVKAEEQNKIIQAENDRKTEELEEARQLQLAMLPKELPQLPNMDIAVYMNTATEVGGDYYDFHLNPDGTLTVVIGDATGHGMKAGSMVTVSKSLFNTLAMSKDIQKTFKRMSRVIKEMKFLNLAMCLTMLKMNGNKLQISSAGMPPVLFYSAEKSSVLEFAINGMPLGTFNDFPYGLKEIEVSRGDTLLLMSDGFPELMNEQNEMYGYERVAEKFQGFAKYNPEQIINELKKEETLWVGNSDPDDDVTFVVIKIK